MVKNPYKDLPSTAFWKTGVAQEDPCNLKGIYKKKFNIKNDTKIATAGSCFAQHISRHLRANGFSVLDVEPPPEALPTDQHQKFGYSMYSARYGNIYTIRQLSQLVLEVSGSFSPKNFIWEKNGKYFDALRPGVEPEGLDSKEEVIEHRKLHISRVRKMIKNLDIFIFTLGLTEMWIHKSSGTVYPTAPGTLVGEFDNDLYEFVNGNYASINKDFRIFLKTIKKIRKKPLKILLTVSPVPLTATASGGHVLSSTIHSKSILRAVAGKWSQLPNIDYFPSFEIVTNPKNYSKTFSDNLRTVRNETVEMVMKHFFSEHKKFNDKNINKDIKKDKKVISLSLENDIQCEEEFLENIK